MARMPKVQQLVGGNPAVCDGTPTASSHLGKLEPKKAVKEVEKIQKAMACAIEEGLAGGVTFGTYDQNTPRIQSRKTMQRESMSGEESISKSAALLDDFLSGPDPNLLRKEWTLTNPIGSGLVPFDLEAPAKLIWPHKTPLRNSIPRIRAQGGAHRFKVITGATGSLTGGISSMNPGISESTLTTGVGGLQLVRPPLIQYAGQDVVLSQISYGLQDAVSFQAEYEGQGFDDIRTQSATTLLYTTMMAEERLICYGRGQVSGGYTGPLATASISSVSAVSASVAPGGKSTLGSGAVWVIAAADAGDLVDPTGTKLHQGPVSSAASVTVSAGQAVQVNLTDVTGALGYLLYAASVVGGPYYYAGRTGWSTGYVTSQPTSGISTTPGAADQSAPTNTPNFDGLLTSVSASGGYVTRLNAPWSTTSPGSEVNTALASLWESTKADPEEIWVNGYDRLGLSNALINNSGANAYRITIANSTESDGVKVGAVVSSILNEVTGSEVDLKVHPNFPQGNALIRQVEMPLPNSNIGETSAMAMVQDYTAVQFPVIQLAYEMATFQIGTLANTAELFGRDLWYRWNRGGCPTDSSGLRRRLIHLKNCLMQFWSRNGCTRVRFSWRVLRLEVRHSLEESCGSSLHDLAPCGA